MRALIVDSDRISRAVLRRLLSHAKVEVAEAEDGLSALAVLDSIDPDFVVLDTDMTVLNGIETLRAIRQSHDRANLPVVCVSAAPDREKVARAMALGAADFLAKPIVPVEALPRIKGMITRTAHWRQRPTRRTAHCLLLVFPEPHFLAYARPLLEGSFDVMEARSTIQAALLYRESGGRPTVVCVGENMPLLAEDRLAEVLPRLAAEAGVAPPQVFLMADSDAVAPEVARAFAGVVRKSFVPDRFLESFRTVVLRDLDPVEKLRHIVSDELRVEVFTAAQQTVGVMLELDIERVTDPSPALAEAERAVVPLRDPVSGLAVRLEVAAAREEVPAIASAVMHVPVTMEDGAHEVLAEIANALGGRVRASLETRGYPLKLGLPERIAAGSDDSDRFDLRQGYRCGAAGVLWVSLEIREERHEDAAAGPAGEDDVAAEAA